MKYVQRVVGTDGVERLYFRRKGYPRAPLANVWGSDELKAEVDALCAQLAPEKPLPGTMRAAVRAYELEDADFLGLADSTKALYRIALKEFEEDLGALPLKAFTPAFVLKLKNAWATRGHRAANVRLQVLSNVLQPALIGEVLDKDPFPLVGQVRRPAELAEPHRIWPMAVVDAVIQRAIEEEKYGVARAVAIGRYVGARRDDLTKISRRARQGGRFQFMSGKRRVQVDVLEDPALTRILDRTPDAPKPSARRGRKLKAGVIPAQPVTLVYNLAGRAYTPKGLADEVCKIVAKLHKAGEIDSDKYDVHGLRHTRGVEAALAGCTDAQGAALLGQADPRSFVQYRRQADRINMADDASAKIADLREHRANAVVKNQVKNRCKTPKENG